MNPFLLKGYAGPKYFCDREEETSKIIDSLKNGQDITIYAYRRLGKSALIHHISKKLSNDFHFIYADIWGTNSLNEFVKELTNAIIRSDIFTQRSLTKKLQDFIQSLGASFSIGLDGMPSVDLIYNDKNRIFRSLEDLISFLNRQSKSIVLAIDEFQEIKKYDNKHLSIEATLRKLTQQSQNIRFIYSGSEFHLINQMFNDYNRPFYQSTRMINLNPIEKQKYLEFIQYHFKKRKVELNVELIDQILEFSYGHTYYVQAIFNYLYSLDQPPQNWKDFEKVYYPFIMEKGVFYAELPNRLTAQQFVVTKAFAKAGKVSSPMASDFLNLAGFSNSSSMRRAVHSLESKQVIIKDGIFYRLYDVFLEHYLKFNS